MFFVASKVLGFLAIPSNDLILLGLCGVVLLATPWRRGGVWLTSAAILLFAVIGFSPLGNALILPLENRFPPWDASRGPPTGIVVLGGAISPEISAARNEPQLNEAAERVVAAVELARRYPDARLVYSGGSGGLIFNKAMEADYALILFERLGIPRDRVMIERRSRNTIENARFSKALVHPKPGERWLLVTSAEHMPRAIGCFRKVGFPVEAYPVDWRTGGSADLDRLFYKASEGIARVDVATREWAGLLAYWATGRSSALFPGPLTERSLSPAAADRGGTRP